MNPNSNNNNNQNPNYIDINQMYNYQEYNQPNLSNQTSNPMGLDLNSFLPQQHQQPQIVSQSNDQGVIDDMMKQSECFKAIIANRIKGLKTMASTWQEGNKTEAINSLQQIRDLGVVNDFLSNGLIKSELNKIDIKSDSFIEVFPFIIQMASSKHDEYVKTAINASWVILKFYYDIVIQTKKANLINAGIDLNRDDRIKKYDVIIHYLTQLRQLPNSLELGVGNKTIDGLQARQFFSELDYFLKSCSSSNNR